MACGDFTQWIDYLSHGQPFDYVFCQYEAVLGGTVFALFVFGTILLGYRIQGGSIVVPLVLVVMLGAVIVVQLPGIAVNALVVMFMLGTPLAVIYLIMRIRER